MVMLISPKVPLTIRRSCIFWFIAIGAGIFETLLVLFRTIFLNVQQDGLLPGIMIRVFLFALMSYIIVQMSQGKNWARLTLFVALGILGTLSLIIGPIGWLLHNQVALNVFESWTFTDWLFSTSRIAHIIAVWAGVIFMFLPTSNKYFRNILSPVT